MTDATPPSGGLQPVALVGAGNMGGAMVARLAGLGWPVAVCDTDAAARARAQGHGARVCASPQAAVQAARTTATSAVTLFIVVVDAAQTTDVLWGPEGAATALRPGDTVCLCPTIAPEDVEAIARRLQDAGVHALDAPMSGGPQRAQAGQMSLMVAGPAPVVEANRALLEALASPVFVVSQRPGDGARTKLVNNLAAGIHLVAAAEVLALAERMGLDLPTTLSVMERSSGQSWIGSDRMRRAIAGDFEPRAHMTLLQKDTRLAVQAAAAVGFEGPLGQRAAQVFAQAAAGGLAERDDGALLSWLRQLPTMKR